MIVFSTLLFTGSASLGKTIIALFRTILVIKLSFTLNAQKFEIQGPYCE